MRLSRATVYAVQALAYLARHEGEGPLPSHVIAGEEGMSGSFLLKALNTLAEARLVRPERGARGGYRLTLPAKDVTLLDVVEAVEGVLRYGSCALRSDESCARTAISPICSGHIARTIRFSWGRPLRGAGDDA